MKIEITLDIAAPTIPKFGISNKFNTILNNTPVSWQYNNIVPCLLIDKWELRKNPLYINSVPSP